MILSGKIEAGRRLVEAAIAAELGVSRTPVREALHKLGLESLVQSIPRVGYIVNDMSEYDIEDLFTTRAAIEQLVAGCALEKITPDELDKLERNLGKTDQILKAGLTKKMIDLDSEFHEMICKASRSKRLYQIAQMLREHMLKLEVMPSYTRNSGKGPGRSLSRSSGRSRPKTAQNSTRRWLSHMDNTKKDILAYMRRRQEQRL